MYILPIGIAILAKLTQINLFWNKKIALQSKVQAFLCGKDSKIGKKNIAKMMNQMLDDTSALDFSTDYNWDNLNIGNQTNASSLFFGKKITFLSVSSISHYTDRNLQ